MDPHPFKKPKKSSSAFFITICSAVVLTLLLILTFSNISYKKSSSQSSLPSTSTVSTTEMMDQENYQTTSKLFDNNGRYIFRDYDEAKPMSNFLAGLGGYWGVPMWAFYVNRGQGITSFGVQNKDGAIAKFNTAEKAYQQTPFTGFRTFVKGNKGGKKFSHMPFFPIVDKDIEKPVRTMMIGMNEMELEEISSSHGLKTNILYFTPPDEDFPSLIRSTTFSNLDSSDSLHLDVLDGLGKLIPSGLPNWNLDAMGRTMEAWMNVSRIKLSL
jgi:hypothetical protein